jgi:hypothetical protein
MQHAAAWPTTKRARMRSLRAASVRAAAALLECSSRPPAHRCAACRRMRARSANDTTRHAAQLRGCSEEARK